MSRFALALLLAGCAAPPPHIELVSSDGQHAFSVVGLEAAALDALAHDPPDTEQWRALFTITLEQNRGAALPGHHELADNEIRFVPRFPLQLGMTYHAVLDPEAVPSARPLPRLERSLCLLPDEPGVPPAVVALYPSADSLPENTLRFYLHFRTPMRQGDVYDHLHLVRDDGFEVQWPFLEIGEELWDPDGTRLTLLCDPGRVKRGLRPREEDGPILEEGRAFTLVVDGTWRDAAGHPLGASFRRAFRVTAPDAVQPEPRAWQVQTPTAGQRDALTVHFAQPVDHALLGRMIWVEGPQGVVAGDVAIETGERSWRFTPTAPWLAGDYRLVADTELEDPSGNSIRAPFEVDAVRGAPLGPDPETAVVRFAIPGS